MASHRNVAAVRQDGNVAQDRGSHDGVDADGFSAPTLHSAGAAANPSGAPANPAGQPRNTLPLPGEGVGTPPDAGRTENRRPGDGGSPSDGVRRGTSRPAPTGNVTVTRAVVARSRYISKLVAHKVISASEADGARESGLTAMIWNQVMSYGADAMVTVALAGTVFFSAPSQAQRGNVLLYLLITMAPFAVVAPIIGPALDRVQHGRRWVMAGTAIGRAVLAVVMAQNFNDLLVLFPAALGSLVLSKAYAVIRSSAAPRLVPHGLTLVEANARLTIFGLAAALIGGGIVGVAIKLTGSYPLGLWITAAAFAVTAFYAFRLPKIVDTLPDSIGMSDERADYGAGPSAAQTRRASAPPASSPLRRFGRRFMHWMSHGFTDHVIFALQGESTLRWLSGFLTIFLAFYIEAVSHGWHAVLSLGGVGLATGVGNFAGTGIGTRLKLARPHLIVLLCMGVSAIACIVTAVLFSVPMAILATLISATGNSLAKLSLDAVIQRDVAESSRSSAFGRSETFLQLSWVVGATVVILLPARNGQLGFIVAAAVTALASGLLLVRRRAMRGAQQREPLAPRPGPHPGNVAP
ncbi:MAG: transporter [Frankiales bacterium]|nr:transporter [Frankiales bacterium]